MAIKQLTIHPLANLLPMIEGDELEQLKEDIRINGLRVPILTLSGQILDGRNRYGCLIALEAEGHEVELKSEEWDGRGSLAGLIASLNLNRRHLTSSQRAACAAEILGQLETEAATRKRLTRAQREKAAGVEGKGRAREEAAKLYGTSPRQVARAKAIQQADPETLQQVKEGKINVVQAERRVRRKAKLKQLEEISLAAELESRAGERMWELSHVDAVEGLSKVDRGSVRLVFADPPYNQGIDYGKGEDADRMSPAEYMIWVASWMRNAWHALADDGSFWALISEDWADCYGMALREAGFHRRAWIVLLESFGQDRVDNFTKSNRHLFYCVKNKDKFIFNREYVARPSARAAIYGDRRADPDGRVWDSVWPLTRLTDNNSERIPGLPTQLPLDLLTTIVGLSSNPGDLVVDPFNGSGTTGHACLHLGRYYLGLDDHAPTIALARGRLIAAEASIKKTGVAS